MTRTREQEVIGAFVALATSLANGDDVVELLTGLTADCARLLNVESAGLLLADTHGTLHLMATSSQATTALEVLQLQRDEGPCLDCYHAGAAVSSDDLRADIDRWPQFVPAALAGGFASAHAVPMQLRGTILGTLGLFGAHPGALSDDDRDLAQAMAHVASVSLVQDQAAADKDVIVGQLNVALTSRVVLEQAKGFLAQRGDVDLEEAFAVLRDYARGHNERLSDVAAAIVSRRLPPQDVLGAPAAKHPAEQQHKR